MKHMMEKSAMGKMSKTMPKGMAAKSKAPASPAAGRRFGAGMARMGAGGRVRNARSA